MNKPEWTYCRNCVDNYRHGDDGCCEGVPKVARGGK